MRMYRLAAVMAATGTMLFASLALAQSDTRSSDHQGLAQCGGELAGHFCKADRSGGKVVVHADAADRTAELDAPAVQTASGQIVTNPDAPAPRAAQSTSQAGAGKIVVNPDAPTAATSEPGVRGVPLDTPYSISIFAQNDTSRPFEAGDYTADGSFTIQVVDGSCTAATYTVAAAPVAASGPGGSTPPFTTVTAYIGFGDGTFLFNNAGAGDYTVTVTQTNGTCNIDPGSVPGPLTVTINDAPLDPAFGLSIDSQTATSRPFIAPDYTADGSFVMRTTDPASCDGNGLYTVNATPVAGSGPGGSTPPLTTITSYINFGDGAFLFANAGAGDYTVTATETGGDCAYESGDNPQVQVVTVAQGAFDTPFAMSITNQTNTSLPFADPAYAPDGSFTVGVADGSCTGTYTVNAAPVGGSGPGGTTPPSTTIVTYIGFPAGFSFAFANAGIGDYIVTVTETGACTFDPNDPQTRIVTIAGNQPVLDVAPATLDFGDVEVGTVSAAGSVTLGNSGTANLSISAIDAPAAPFAAAGGTCGALPITILPGNNCTLDYTFSPAVPGPASDTIAIQSTSTPAVESFDLVGNGTQAIATLDASSFSLGPILTGQLDSAIVTVTSSGNIDLVISQVTSPAAPFSLVGGTCLAVPVTLANGESCTIEIRFLPGDDVGSFASSFDIISNAASSPDTVDLEGSAQAPLAVPTLGPAGLLLLMLSLLLIAGTTLTRRIV